MKGRETAETITRALWRQMRDRGRGTIRAVEARMGWKPRTLHEARRRESGLRVAEVGAVLEALDLSPAEFFAETFEGRGDQVRATLSAPERFLAEGSRLRRAAKLPRLAAPDAPDRLSGEDLERLDAARLEDPMRAVELAATTAAEAAAEGRRGDAAAAVARQGSAHRVVEEHDAAHACLWWAISTAEKNSAIRADAWLRTGSVAAARGDLNEAVELSNQALVLHAQLADMPGVGKSLVSRSMFLQRDGRTGEAITGYCAALVCLAPGDLYNRFAAHQSLGIGLLEEGSIGEAERHAAAAAEIVPKGSPRALSHLAWLRARIAVPLRRYTQAEQHYEAAISGGGLNVGDTVIATAELCRVYLLAGRPHDALRRARHMAALVPDRGNRIITAALLDLVRSALAGELTLAHVDLAIERLKKAGRADLATRPAAL